MSNADWDKIRRVPIKPAVGDRVQLMGRKPRGRLKRIGGPSNTWCVVDWEPDHHGPQLCHIRELTKIEEED